jgi:dihydroorotate dehydrogenase (NAD+) catalytic subunit
MTTNHDGRGRVTFCGLRLAHPVVNGSGTFDAIAARRVFGEAVLEHFPFAAFVTKTVTLEPRQGNPPPRLWELGGGLLNSIGLPNKGLRGFLASDLPQLRELPVPLIVNVMGASAGEFAKLVTAIAARAEVAALELNVSCPNVKTGLDIGAVPGALRDLIRHLRPLTDKPLIVKLTPNTTDVAATASAAQEGGADAVSLINTLRGMALAPGTAAPWLGGVTGGVSGPAIGAVAMAQVYSVRRAVSVPIVGMGGIRSARHALDLMRAGADLIAVGSENFRNPIAAAEIASQLASLSSAPAEAPQTAAFSARR